MTERRKRKAGNSGNPVKRRSSAGRPSLDNLMGKALCILLVVILTVGAFLAPKMINNLYDAGTLMQITYMDLDLSTYAVAYTSFPEKIEAIARAKTAGEKLTVLSSEETDGKISDEELTGITNGEMEELRDSLVMLFWEDWWNDLTEENLVSREKNTLYAQPAGEQDGASGPEMAAPVQFWTLTFELTEDQKAQELEEYKMKLEESDVSVTTWPPFEYASERLIVCLDADFYKIYAVGIEGATDKMWMQYEVYGWEFPDMLGVGYPLSRGEKWTEEIADYTMDARMNLTDRLLEDWAIYWGVRPEDDIVYGLAKQGEVIGYMIFLNEEEKAETDPGAQSIPEAAVGEDSYEAYDAPYDGGGKKEIVVYAGADGDKEGNASYGGEKAEGAAYGDGGGNRYADQSIEREYADWSGGDEMLLAVGCSGQWGGENDEMWIQRAGCREFFEMMQF